MGRILIINHLKFENKNGEYRGNISSNIYFQQLIYVGFRRCRRSHPHGRHPRNAQTPRLRQQILQTKVIPFSLNLLRGFKPISKSFFALPSSNPSEQFIYFVQLVSWLLSINNHQVTGWNKYDDPMTASQNVSKPNFHLRIS